MNAKPARAAPYVVFIPFAVVLFDSLFAYFARPFGIQITANAVVPLLLLFIGIYRFEWIRLPVSTVAWLVLLVVALSIAVFTAPSVGVYRILEAGSCMASFTAGYLMWRNASDADQIALWLLIPPLIYVAVCLVALSGIDPVHFPVKVHYWSQNGIPQPRPRLTADANMQIYYLFPAALSLLLPFKTIRMAVLVPAVVGSLYILAQLQTRSGVIVYCAVVLLTILAPLWIRNLGRAKVFFYPVTGVALAVAFWPILMRATELLIYRFSQDDVANANGRVDSTLYFFEILFDPRWWIPQGVDEYAQLHGGLPHSNLAGVYLDGGLLGLVAWAALTVFPIMSAGLMFLLRRLDAAGTMALVAAIAALMIQLSLHNPTHDHVWLWAGALIGALTRLRLYDAKTEALPDSGAVCNEGNRSAVSLSNEWSCASKRFPNLQA